MIVGLIVTTHAKKQLVYVCGPAALAAAAYAAPDSATTVLIIPDDH